MKGVLAAILWFFLFQPVLKAQNFEPFNISDNVVDPFQVETIDLDSNGLDDFIVTGAEKIYWFKNTGNGQFDKISLADSLDSFWHFALFDWENDGDIDIFFTTYYTDQRVAWLENDGSENFTYHLISKTIDHPYYIKPWDLDRDNDVDILVSSSSTDQLYWLKNDGFNNFTQDTIGDYVHTFSIADLQGDGDWDIIFGRAYVGITSSSVRAFQNDSLNNFTLVTLSSGYQIIHEVIVEDVNGDSLFDIVVPDYYGDKIEWLINDGSYGFSTKYTITTNFDGPEGIALFDVNEDGKKDLIAGSYNADKIYYFQGQGTTTSYWFNTGSLIYSGLNQISDLAIGNFDNQNKKDFVHTDVANDEISVWLNNGSQVFTQNKLSATFDSPRFFDMGDLDGDGDQDVASVSNDGDMVAWMENLDGDEFDTHILISNYEEPYVVKINDLDDDGDNDIIAASDFDDRMTWWENDGSGNFTMTHITTSLNGPRDLWIEDFDLDGDKDIATICYWLTSKSGFTGAQLFKNDGSENFTRAEIEDDIRAGRCVRGAEMNGDSLVDLVFSSHLYTQSELNIAKNNGSSFTVSSLGYLRCEDFEICDFDGDNDNDILAVDADLDSIYMFENNGNLSFTKKTIAHFPDLYGIEPRDFDFDGDMDIVFTTGYSGFTNATGYEWGLFRNDSLGNLTAEIWYQNLTNVKPLEVFDYEYDGDLDVMLGFDYQDKITLYKNLDVDCYLRVDAVAQGVTEFCSADSVLLTASTTDTGITYQWFKNNLPLPGDTSASLMVNTSGFYRLKISDSNCTASSVPIEILADSGYFENQYFTFCSGSSILIDTLNISTPGDYTFYYQSKLGCDSTVVAHVTMANNDSTALYEEICSGNTYNLNGTMLTQSGMYFDTLVNNNNCDSIITLNLIVHPSYQQNQAFQICSGDSVFTPGGYWVSQAGIYPDTMQTNHGCDSIWNSQIAVNPTYFTNDSIAVCQGDSVLLGGAYRKQAGVYIDSLTANNSCDSILSTTLHILPNSSSTQQLSICMGDSIFLANAWQTSAGNYVDHLTASNGCDSILTSTLTVNPTKSDTVQVSICRGDSTFAGGMWQKTTGTYVDIWSTTKLCDSIVTTQLTVKSVDTSVFRTGNTFTANANSAAFQWLDCDQNFAPLLNDTNAKLVPTTNGSYAVQVTQNECVDTSQCFSVLNIGLAENGAAARINIYPNPSSGQIEIAGEFDKDYEEYLIVVIGMNGSVLLSQNGKTQSGKLQTTFDLSQLANGSYQIQIQLEEEIFVRTIIVRK